MYLGLGVGFLNTLFVQPAFLSTSEIGLTKVLFSFSMLFSTLLPMGANNITLRYFPRFKDSTSGDHGFLGLVTGMTLLGFFIYGALLMLFSHQIIAHYSDRSPEFSTYFYWIFPMGLSLALVTVINSYCNGHFKSSFPTLLNDVIIRLTLIGSILLYHWEFISWGTYIVLFAGCFILQLILVLLYVATFTRLNFRFDWQFMTREENSEILRYGVIFLLSSVASMGLKTLDVIVLAQFLPLSAVGVYGLVALFPTIIETPLNSLEKIAGPKLTEAMSLGNRLELSKIYKESAHHLLVLGGWLFLMIVLNVKDFLQLLPFEFRSSYHLVYILAAGNLVNMATGVNNPLVYYSDHYKMGVSILLSTLVLAIVNYYLFIPLWGLEGAAFATVLSNLIMNCAKTTVIWIKFRINPFDRNTFLILILVAFCCSALWINLNFGVVLNIGLRGGLVSMIYLGAIWIGNLSPENPLIKLVQSTWLSRQTK